MKEVKSKSKPVHCDSLPDYLELRGLSCRELEEKCHLEEGSLAMQCTGKKKLISPETAKKVAEILGVSDKDLGLFPCHNLDYYRKQRGISRDKLEAVCGMDNNLYDAFHGTNKRMRYRKISKVAEALCVDIDDLGAPDGQRIDIPEINKQMETIHTALSDPKIRRITLRKVSEGVISLLSMDHEEEDLKACIRYLICESNYLGRSLAYSRLIIPPDPELNSSNALAAIKQFWPYLKRDYTYESLGDYEPYQKVSRQTVSNYINGKKTPNSDQIYWFCEKLKLEYYLVAQDDFPPFVSIEKVEQDIKAAIKMTKPKVLRETEDLILPYIKHWDGYLDRLLDYLLLSSSTTQKREAVKILQDMMECPRFYQKHYKPDILIRYSQEDEEDDGVYTIDFLLDADQLDKNKKFFNLLRDILSNPPMMNYVLSDETFLDSLLSAMDEKLSELDGDLPSINKNLSFKVLLKNILSDKQILDMLLSDDSQKKEDYLIKTILLNNTIYLNLDLPSPFVFSPMEGEAKIPPAEYKQPYQIETESSPDDNGFEDEIILDFLDNLSDSRDLIVLCDYFDMYWKSVRLVECTCWDITE